jgi:hypothetical protein
MENKQGGNWQNGSVNKKPQKKICDSVSKSEQEWVLCSNEKSVYGAAKSFIDQTCPLSNLGCPVFITDVN